MAHLFLACQLMPGAYLHLILETPYYSYRIEVPVLISATCSKGTIILFQLLLKAGYRTKRYFPAPSFKMGAQVKLYRLANFTSRSYSIKSS